MTIERAKGVITIKLILQALLFSIAFWLWVAVFRAQLIHGLDWVFGYVTANGAMVGGLLLAYARTPGDWRSLQPGFQPAVRQALGQMAYMFGVLFGLLVLTKDQRVSRFFLAAFAPVGYMVLVWTNRYLPQWISDGLLGQRWLDRILVVGPADLATRFATSSAWTQRLGCHLVGLLCDEPPAAGQLPLRVLGSTGQLSAVLREQHVTRVVLLGPLAGGPNLEDLISACEHAGVSPVLVPDLGTRPRGWRAFDFGDILALSFREEPLQNPWNRFLKRMLDLAFCLPVMLVVLPAVTWLVWIFQRCQSPGPVFHRQTRSGLFNQRFEILKFRSMHTHNHDLARQASSNDDRIFPAGRWLRRFSLDELPQFINVLNGDMSVVGPRPHLPEHDEQFARVLRSYHLRTRVKPGLTGLAQVRGFRGEVLSNSDIVNRVSSDIHYIENWSLTLDVWIAFRTVAQVLFPPSSAR